MLPSSRRAALNVEVLTCRGTVPKATRNRQPPHQQRRETREVRHRYKLPCGRIEHFQRAVSQTSADLDGQDGWTVVKRKRRGRKQAGGQ